MEYYSEIHLSHMCRADCCWFGGCVGVCVCTVSCGMAIPHQKNPDSQPKNGPRAPTHNAVKLKTTIYMANQG